MRWTVILAIIVGILGCVWSSPAGDVVHIRFEIDRLHGYICLQVRVNDRQEPEWFIFDTGSNAIFLTPEASNRLNIKYDKTQQVATTEESTIRGGYRASEEMELRLGERFTARIHRGAFVVLEEESDKIPPVIVVGGKFFKVAGIIGISVFPKHYVNISYTQNELIVSTAPFDLKGWQEVTAAREGKNLPFIRLKVGDEEMPALLDSGCFPGLVVSFSVWQRLVRTDNKSEAVEKPQVDDFHYSAKSFPPVKIGDYPLMYDLITITSHERSYLLLGSLEMLLYDWIINTNTMQVYAKRRAPLPKIHGYIPLPMYTGVFFLFDDKDFLATSGIHWNAGRAGLTGECVVVAVNGIAIPSLNQVLVTPEVFATKILPSLLASPFEDSAQLRVRCEDGERDIRFRILPSYKLLELFNRFFPFSFNFTYEGAQFIVKFPDERWRPYLRVDGQPVKEFNQEQLYRLVRVKGLREDFTFEEFVDFLYSNLSRNQSVVLICADDSGREVEVEVLPRRQVQSEAAKQGVVRDEKTGGE